MFPITRDALWQRIERGDPLVVVEALPESYYRKAHLPGAINIPHHRIDELAPQLLPDRSVDIVVYCANLACENSAIAAERLIALGYQQVYDYAEGKQDWLDAGLPVERSRATPADVVVAVPANDKPVVACSLDEEDLAARAASVAAGLFAGAVERCEIETGYAFRFPADTFWKAKIDEFVETERRCCSFFQIDLTFEPGLGPIWMRLTGPHGTKQFIEETFDTAEVARITID
jgi:rhodanese-related sulfurtransferase